MDQQTIINFGIAILIGALIGVEREKRKQKIKHQTPIGLRTSLLFSIVGAVCGYLSTIYSYWILIFGLLAISIVITVAYYIIAKQQGRVGITTETSGIVVFILSALSTIGQTQLAIVLGIITAFTLASKEFVHKKIKQIEEFEILDLFKFAVIAFVILPLLPNENYGPFEFFNPYRIWFLVVLVAGISFAAYILVKKFGQKKGLNLTGFLSGFLSSTATITSFSQKAKNAKHYRNLVSACLLAYGSSLIITLIELAILNQELFQKTLIPLSLGVLSTWICSFFILFNTKKLKEKHKIEFKTPFQLKEALQFGALFIGILFLSNLSQEYFGHMGIYATSILSGLASMDAITLSMAELGGNSIELSVAANAILIGHIVSVASKTGIAYFFGGKKFGNKILKPFLITGIILIASGVVFL